MSTTRQFDRRLFLRGATVAAAAVASAPLLGFREMALAATADAQGQVFGYGVASGDPLADAVILWTRVNASPEAVPGSGVGAPVEVVWELAADEAFISVVRTGSTRTDAGRDHTVKVDVTGLAAYTRYFYRFTALGTVSPVGRTQTAPDEAGTIHALRFAFTSCANFTGGYFTPYRHLAARDDLDFVLCLGDYLYEYGNDGDRYGPDELRGVREHEPNKEMTVLADYRLRYATYRADADLADAHRRHPWIVIFDDHEVTNNTYDVGAQNHQASEGDFFARREQAYQAYLEWMPIRLPDQTGAAGTRFWRRFSFGPLADLSVVETRQNRSEQVGATDTAALASPDRQFMEREQRDWLTSGLSAADRRWHLVGNQVVFTQVRLPSAPEIVAMLPAAVPVSEGGAVFNADAWDGYLVDQDAVIDAMGRATGDPVVFTGDIHSSWANDIPTDPGTYVPGPSPANNSVGTEFVCPSVTSDGFYEVAQRQLAGALGLTTAVQAANRHVRFLDGVNHGYAVADVTPARLQVDFVWLTSSEDPATGGDPRLDPQAGAAVGASWQTLAGSRQVSTAPAPIGPRSDSPRAAVGGPIPVVPELPKGLLAPTLAAVAVGGVLALRRRGAAQA